MHESRLRSTPSKCAAKCSNETHAKHACNEAESTLWITQRLRTDLQIDLSERMCLACVERARCLSSLVLVRQAITNECNTTLIWEGAAVPALKCLTLSNRSSWSRICVCMSSRMRLFCVTHDNKKRGEDKDSMGDLFCSWKMAYIVNEFEDRV